MTMLKCRSLIYTIVLKISLNFRSGQYQMSRRKRLKRLLAVSEILSENHGTHSHAMGPNGIMDAGPNGAQWGDGWGDIVGPVANHPGVQPHYIQSHYMAQFGPIQPHPLPHWSPFDPIRSIWTWSHPLQSELHHLRLWKCCSTLHS